MPIRLFHTISRRSYNNPAQRELVNIHSCNSGVQGTIGCLTVSPVITYTLPQSKHTIRCEEHVRKHHWQGMRPLTVLAADNST